MTQFGVYDTAQKAWLFILDSFEEAERAMWAHDSKTAVVHPAPDGANSAHPPEVEPGGLQFPAQDEVVVHPTSGANKVITPVVASGPTLAPDVAADVSAQTVRHEGPEEDAQPTQTRRQAEGGAEKCQ